MSDLTPIEHHIRSGEVLDPTAQLVIRGWPLTIEGLLHNADATRRRYSMAGRPFVAISADVTVGGWDVDAILSRPRLRTRRSYAAVLVGRLTEAGFDLLATFGAPHYSVILPSYTQRGSPAPARGPGRGQGQPAPRQEGAVTDHDDVAVTLPADVNQVDETGFVWAFLDNAAEPPIGCVPAR